MGFNILFENDSVVGRVEEVTRSGMQTLYIRPDSAFAIRSIHGFIYYTDSDPAVNKPGLIINNITLTRYHEPADTVRVDAEDSLAMERNVDAMQMEKKADTLDASSIRPSSVRQQD